MKRISFSKQDAESIYECCLAMHQIDPFIIDHCPVCGNIMKRLKKFLGPEAKKIQRLVKEHPYVKV